MTGRIGDIVLMAFLQLLSIALLLWGFILPVVEARDIRSWTATPCEITRSEVGRIGGIKHRNFKFDVSYTYSFGGTTYTGERPKLQNSWSRWRVLDEGGSEAEDMAQRYPLGMRTTCYVNPKTPSESILDPSFRLSVLHVVLALLVIFAGYGLFRVVRRRVNKELRPGDFRNLPRFSSVEDKENRV